jgi:hypothetical protein
LAASHANDKYLNARDNRVSITRLGRSRSSRKTVCRVLLFVTRNRGTSGSVFTMTTINDGLCRPQRCRHTSSLSLTTHCTKHTSTHVNIPTSPSNQCLVVKTSSSQPGQAPDSNEKEKKKHACQTSINTHPERAPEGKTAIRVEIIKRKKQLSIQQKPRRQLPPSLRTDREDQKVFTLGCRGYTLINQGGICGSFREPREGRIL